MLTPNELEAIPMGIMEIFHNLQMEIAGDVVKRIAKNREITSAADWQITRLYELGTSKQFIDKVLKVFDNKSYEKRNQAHARFIERGA